MKKLLLYSVAIFLFAYSCSKEKSNQGTTPKQTAKKYAVNFSVNGFTQTINSVNKKILNGLTTSSIADNATVLYYYAQNSSGSFVTQLRQTSTNPEFGNIADSLAAGTYTIGFIAGQTGLLTYYIGDSSPGFNHLYCSYNKAVGQFAPWQDTFDTLFTLKVSGPVVSQPVSLNRIVGEIQVDVQDTIPANLKTIQLTFDYEDAGYRVDTDTPINPFDTPRSYITTTTVPDSVIGKTNYMINTIIGNTITPINVTITCLDASNNTLSITSVPNVSCQKNVKTVLTGKLFAAASIFQVSYNPAWDPTPITVHF